MLSSSAPSPPWPAAAADFAGDIAPPSTFDNALLCATLDGDLSGNSCFWADGDDDDLADDSFVLNHIIGLALPTAAALSVIHDVELDTVPCCFFLTYFSSVILVWIRFSHRSVRGPSSGDSLAL